MPHPAFKRIAALAILLGVLVAPAHLALAQGAKFTNPLGSTSLKGIIETMVRFLLSFVGILTLGALVWGGVLYIISLGNDAYIKQAKTIIFWAIVGLIVVTLAFVIISTVSQFLGI